MKKVTQSCRTCAFWAKPRKKRVTANSAYECRAPFPDGLPDSITLSGYWPPSRMYMMRDEGKECPAYELPF